MYKAIFLNDQEANLVDYITEVYNLPLAYSDGLDEDTSERIESGFFYDCEQDEKLSIKGGLDYIDEALACDDWELANEKLTAEEVEALQNLLLESRKDIYEDF